MQKSSYIFLIFCFIPAFHFGQAIGDEYNKEMLRKETSWGISLNSNGYGLTYRRGKEKTIFKKVLYEFDFAVKKNPKEIKAKNPFFTNSKDYVFGKLNRFNAIHAGIGVQNVLNHKPYWGGTEIRYVAFTGLSLGMSSPVYLYIINFVPDHKRCVMEARLPNREPLAVNHLAASQDEAFRGASDKLKRALEHTFGKLRDHRARESIRRDTDLSGA